MLWFIALCIVIWFIDVFIRQIPWQQQVFEWWHGAWFALFLWGAWLLFKWLVRCAQ